MRRVGEVIILLLGCAVHAASAQEARLFGPLAEGHEMAVSQPEAPPTIEHTSAADHVAASGEAPVATATQATPAPTRALVSPSESLPLGDGAPPPLASGARARGAAALVDDAGETPQSPLLSGGWVRTTLSLAFVIALVLASSAALKRWGGRGSLGAALGGRARAPSGILEVLARYPVGRGQQIMLLRVDRRVLVVHQSQGGRSGGMTTLSELDDPEDVASLLMKVADAEGRSMSSRFRELVTTYEGAHEPPSIEAIPVQREPLDRGRPAPDPLGSIQSRLAVLRDAHQGIAR